MMFLYEIYDFTEMIADEDIRFILFELLINFVFITKYYDLSKIVLYLLQIASKHLLLLIITYDEWTNIFLFFDITVDIIITKTIDRISS